MKIKNLLIAFLFLGTNSMMAQSPMNALNFDGSDDYVTAALPTIFNDIPNNNFTIETWVKHYGYSRVFFAQLNTTNFVSILINDESEVYLYVGDNWSAKTTTTLTTGVWTHIACTWDASTKLINIYINGVLQTTIAGGTSTTGNDNTMALGAKTDGDQAFNGELDEFRIWDVVRTPCQIAVCMNSEFTVSQPNLITYYNFNQGTAGGSNTGITTLNDFTTNYNGTLHNFGLLATYSNWVTSGAAITSANLDSEFHATDIQVACNSLVWIDGNTYTEDNTTATHTLTSVGGCDSIITLNLTINTIDLSVTQSGDTLTANEAGATYQWLNCPSMSIIDGATSQSYTATTSGEYAVIVDNVLCRDTSACYTVTGDGVMESNFENELLVYPNPTNGELSIDLGANHESVAITILDIRGKIIQSHTHYASQLVNLKLEAPAGVYILVIESGDKKAIVRLLKE